MLIQAKVSLFVFFQKTVARFFYNNCIQYGLRGTAYLRANPSDLDFQTLIIHHMRSGHKSNILICNFKSCIFCFGDLIFGLHFITEASGTPFCGNARPETVFTGISPGGANLCTKNTTPAGSVSTRVLYVCFPGLPLPSAVGGPVPAVPGKSDHQLVFVDSDHPCSGRAYAHKRIIIFPLEFHPVKIRDAV